MGSTASHTIICTTQLLIMVSQYTQPSMMSKSMFVINGTQIEEYKTQISQFCAKGDPGLASTFISQFNNLVYDSNSRIEIICDECKYVRYNLDAYTHSI